MNTAYTLFAILALMQAGDMYSTRKILLAGGIEQNPLMRALIGKLGIEPALTLKALAVMALAWFVLLPYPWAIGLLCAFYAWVLWYNWKGLS